MSRPACTTRLWRAARCSGVGVWRTMMRSRMAGSGLSRVGIGGSCDKPPEPMKRMRRASPAKCAPTARPRAVTRLTVGMAGGPAALRKIGSTGGLSRPPNINSSGCATPWSTVMRRETAGSNSCAIKALANFNASAPATFTAPAGVP